jgi:glycosyltransferase involved in cell wall biosynthesis
VAGEDLPFVSVVVPTLGRPCLSDAAEALLAQDYPADRFEIVVVLNGAPAGAASEVRAITRTDAGPAVRVIERTARNANAARNVGVQAASGDPICLVDDDSLAPAGWLRALVAGALRHPEAGCLGGPVRAILGERPPRTCPEHDLAGVELDEGDGEIEVEEVWGANMAIRRRAFEEVGPLLERLKEAHESEWEDRLRRGGGRIVYIPEAGLWHRPDRNLRLHRLLLRSFALGYTVVAIGQPLRARQVAHQLRLSLAHGVRARCTRGMTDAARSLGSLCAISVGRRRRPWSLTMRPG